MAQEDIRSWLDNLISSYVLENLDYTETPCVVLNSTQLNDLFSLWFYIDNDLSLRHFQFHSAVGPVDVIQGPDDFCNDTHSVIFSSRTEALANIRLYIDTRFYKEVEEVLFDL